MSGDWCLDLGAAGQVDELTVRWSSGVRERFENVSVPAGLILREGLPLLSEPARDR